MKKENKEIAKLTINEILLSMCDITAIFYFMRNQFYKKELSDYSDWRGKNRDKLMEKIYI